MRPEQSAPPTVEAPAAAGSVSGRPELQRLHVGHVFEAVGQTLAALLAGARRVRAAARGAEGAGLREAYSLPLDVRAPGDARVMVAELLSDRVPARVLDDALLVASELVTNSVRHGGVSDGVVVLRMELTAAMVRLEVTDRGRTGVIRPRSRNGAEGGGFGLLLVETLSERWGLERVAGGGARVWAQLSRTPPPANGAAAAR
jgi:anti-sigma regulatory factor (Ser/Thr protein kinase)